jgi:hypothetical protein
VRCGKMEELFYVLVGCWGRSVGGYTPLECAYNKLMLITEWENFVHLH